MDHVDVDVDRVIQSELIIGLYDAFDSSQETFRGYTIALQEGKEMGRSS
jgi:hypothetical protein